MCARVGGGGGGCSAVSNAPPPPPEKKTRLSQFGFLPTKVGQPFAKIRSKGKAIATATNTQARNRPLLYTSRSRRFLSSKRVLTTAVRFVAGVDGGGVGRMA
jgi:hypothetical protein